MTKGHGIVENDYVKLWIEDGILVILYKKDSVIGLNAAKEIMALVKKIRKGISYPVLSYNKNIKAISKEAREFFATKEGCEGLVKGAIVVDSGFSKIIGNLFLSVNKPVIQGKLFTNKEEAIEWLNQE
jgi:hypothetical protein